MDTTMFEFINHLPTITDFTTFTTNFWALALLLTIPVLVYGEKLSRLLDLLAKEKYEAIVHDLNPEVQWQKLVEQYSDGPFRHEDMEMAWSMSFFSSNAIKVTPTRTWKPEIKPEQMDKVWEWLNEINIHLAQEQKACEETIAVFCRPMIPAVALQ